MKLYGAETSANTRRVRVYLREKGLEAVVEEVDFDPPFNEIRSPEFLAKNPAGRIPVLELDDGTWLPESGAIIEYLEEVFPEPTMLGNTPAERANVRAIDRMAHDLFIWLRTYLPHKMPRIMPHLPHYPQVVDALEGTINGALRNLEIRIGDNQFLTNSERPMVADCHLFALMSGAAKFGWELPEETCPRLRAWYSRFDARPSARY